jgi:hypothetical protein
MVCYVESRDTSARRRRFDIAMKEVAMNEPLRDHRGRVMFGCSLCGGALAKEDLFELGLRLPDSGETAEEYRDAELIDDLQHARCLSEKLAG